jgi:DNA repair protein RecO (recombination protein O)
VIVYTYKTIAYQDSSKLVYAYSEIGLISYLARGVMKMSHPLAFAAEPHRLLDITLTKGSLPTLKEATLLNRYEHAKKDLEKTMIHHLMGETLQKNSAPEDDHVKLLSLMKKVFDQIETEQRPIKYAVLFLLKLLYFLGFGLHLKQCASCESNHELGFDIYALETQCSVHGSTPEKRRNHALITSYLTAEVSEDAISDLPDDIVFLEMMGRLYDTHLDYQSKALKETLRYLKKEIV